MVICLARSLPTTTSWSWPTSRKSKSSLLIKLLECAIYGESDANSVYSIFSNRSNKEAKVTNFFQVEEVLRQLTVKFDAKLIHQIMNEERGASLRLLYQVKLALERHFSQADLTVTNLKQKTVDQRAKRTAELALRLPEIHKQYGVEGPTFKSEKLQIIEQKLLKYEVARANLHKKAREDEATEVNMLMSIQQAKRQEAMRKLQENKQFMQDWEAEGRKNWK